MGLLALQAETWTIVGALASVAYTGLTLFLVAETVRLRRVQTDPCVIVRVFHDPERSTLFCMAIENIGNGIAENVTFKLSRPIPSHAFGMESATSVPSQEMMKDGPLVRGIRFLPPRDRRVILWGQFGGLSSSVGDNDILVTARYRQGWRRYKTTSVLDFFSFEGTDASTPPHVKLADSAEKLARTVEHIASGFSKPRIITQTAEEYRRLQDEFVAKQRAKQNKIDS